MDFKLASFIITNISIAWAIFATFSNLKFKKWEMAAATSMMFFWQIALLITVCGH